MTQKLRGEGPVLGDSPEGATIPTQVGQPELRRPTLEAPSPNRTTDAFARRLIALAGDADAHIVVIPAANPKADPGVDFFVP